MPTALKMVVPISARGYLFGLQTVRGPHGFGDPLQKLQVVAKVWGYMSDNAALDHFIYIKVILLPSLRIDFRGRRSVGNI